MQVQQLMQKTINNLISKHLPKLIQQQVQKENTDDVIQSEIEAATMATLT